jgi:hypothetical protein
MREGFGKKFVKWMVEVAIIGATFSLFGLAWQHMSDHWYAWLFFGMFGVAAMDLYAWCKYYWRR